MFATTDRDDQHAEAEFQHRKQRIHQQLVKSMDLAAVDQLDDESIRREVAQLAWEMIDETSPGLEPANRQRLHDELQSELYGLGPLEPLLEDPAVSDILVNGHDEVFVERHGCLEPAPVVFADSDHLMRIIQRVVARVGRRIDEVHPVVDARLPDGSRVNAIIPPLALGGPKLSIRRFVSSSLRLENLVANGSLSEDMAQFLTDAVRARMNILLSGGTGAGKTTLLDALSSAIPTGERIVTVEDSAELVLQHPHVVRLETRPPNNEGEGEFTQRDLLRNSLRMRPDRIIIGEVRGPEALDMLQAMNTGHDGSLSTIHANDTRDALSRLELMVAMTGYRMPVHVVREYIARGVHLVVHVARLKGGIRRVLRVSEVNGFEEGRFRLDDLFTCRLSGVDDRGVAVTQFETAPLPPQCLKRFEEYGVSTPRFWKT